MFDHTSQGPLWDPTLSAYYYTYSPSQPHNSPSPTTHFFDASSKGPGTFKGVDEDTPVSWLYYMGRWGDDEYGDEVEGQEEFHGFHKWTEGPDGPLFKGLERKEPCLPRNVEGCHIRTKL